MTCIVDVDVTATAEEVGVGAIVDPTVTEDKANMFIFVL